MVTENKSNPVFENVTRLVTDVPETLKIWFADYCRRNRITMSKAIRAMITHLWEEETSSVQKEKARKKQEQ